VMGAPECLLLIVRLAYRQGVDGGTMFHGASCETQQFNPRRF
jgi:hypothetical protein